MQISPPSAALASITVFLSASLWGLYWIPLRHLDDLGVQGGWAVAALNLPAAMVLLPVVAWQWGRHHPHVRASLMIGLMTGLGLAFYASGLIYSSVVRATLLFYLTPVWATLIGIVWLGERASWSRWAAIAAGLAGLLLLVSGGGPMPLNIGDFFAILSGVCWAIGASLVMRHADVPVPGMIMVMFLVTTVVAIMLGGFAGAVLVPRPDQIVAALPVGTGISIIAFLPAVWAIFWAQKYLFPGRAGLLMMSEVLTAVISASLLLPEEQMSATEWVGASLIIGACLIEVLITPDQRPRTA